MKLDATCQCGGARAASHFQSYVETFSHQPRGGEPYSFRLIPSSLDDLAYVLEGAEDLPSEEAELRAYLSKLSPLEAMCRAVVASKSSLFGYPTNPVTPVININIDYGHSVLNDDTGRLVWPGASPDLLYYDLPGHGTEGRCGVVSGSEGTPELVGCVAEDSCHYAHLTRYHCGRPQCPDWHCLVDYCLRKAEDGVDRLKAADYLYNDTRERIQHVVLSWDPDSDLSWLLSRKAFNRQVQKAYGLLMEAGLRGGMAVVHVERWKGEEGADASGDPVKLFPADALKNGLEWHVGPHIHVVGYGWLDPDKVADIYARTGIVIKSIASRNAEGERLGEDDVREILAYCLSHAGVGFPICGEGKAVRVLRSFGTFSSRSKNGLVRVKQLSESERLECPVCKKVADYPEFPSFLYNLRGFVYYRMGISDEPEPAVKTERYGVFCTRVSLKRVRADLEGLSPSEVVEYARDNPGFVFTRCRFPDPPKPRGMPRDPPRGVSDAEFAEAAEAILRKLGLWKEAGGDA